MPDLSGLGAFLAAAPGGYLANQRAQQQMAAQQLDIQAAQDLRRASLASLLDSQGVDPTTATIAALSGQPIPSGGAGAPGPMAPPPMGGPPAAPPPTAAPALTRTAFGAVPAPSAPVPPTAPAGPPAGVPPQVPGPSAAPPAGLPFGGAQMSLGQMFQRLRADPRNRGIPDTTLLGIAQKAQQSLMAPDRMLLQYLMQQQITPAQRMAHEDRLAGIAASHEDRQATLDLRRDLAKLGMDKAEQAKWQVLVDPANNNTPFRYNASSGQSTTLDGRTPYTPGAVQKMPAGTQPRSAPAMALQKYMQEHPEATAEDITAFASKYQQQIKAARDFGTGKQGDQVRSFNTVIQHLDVVRNMYAALQSGDVQAINRARQAWQAAFGSADPTNFDAVKGIVGQEVVKSIVAGGGGVTERQEAGKVLSRWLSPEQSEGTISGLEKIMAGQLNSLRQQYERTTGLKDFDQTMLMPHTIEVMRGSGYETTGGTDTRGEAPAGAAKANDPLGIR